MGVKPAKRRIYQTDIRLEEDLKACAGISGCPVIRRSEDLSRVFNGLAQLKREVLVSGVVDGKCRLIHWSLLGVGSSYCVSLRIGDAYQDAIRLGAMGI